MFGRMVRWIVWLIKAGVRVKRRVKIERWKILHCMAHTRRNIRIGQRGEKKMKKGKRKKKKKQKAMEKKKKEELVAAQK
jgi:hypothetical protein